uniref:Uncharacterized protein n=1 Tax=Anguilla anguilla TaxID=7936 RepID=A0A0E9WNQ7_ANGAN
MDKLALLHLNNVKLRIRRAFKINTTCQDYTKHIRTIINAVHTSSWLLHSPILWMSGPSQSVWIRRTIRELNLGASMLSWRLLHTFSAKPVQRLKLNTCWTCFQPNKTYL